MATFRFPTIQWFGGLFLALIFTACQPETAPVKPPLLTVNDRSYSLAEFELAFDQTLHPGQKLSGIERQELQRAFLLQLIDRELIQQEARVRDIQVPAAEIDAALDSYRQDYPDDSFATMLKERGLSLENWKDELRATLFMEKLLEEAVYPDLDISNEEIDTYYQSHKEEFSRPEQVRVRQILVTDEAEGRRLLGLLRQGEDFAGIARRHSLSPDAEQGGDLGFFSRGEMPAAFDAVVFDLPVGRLSDLVESEYGYHLFLVEEKKVATQLRKAEATPEIRTLLEARKREDLYLDWLQTLRSQATIKVDWSQLETESLP
ncbi:MAG: peptidyl-prolyl cis-trans isomerase [Desulfuromonadales bacterium]|nr:peptidyl-prolyl cis-trans isomerase [Desulfuromonadales bacterium]